LDKVNADAAVASANAATFITTAVKEANSLGLQFTEGEAQAFIGAELEAAAWPFSSWSSAPPPPYIHTWMLGKEFICLI